MAAPQLSLKARALQWLAQREHSRLELRRKLLRLARQRAADEAAATGCAQDGAGEGAPDPQAEVDALLEWLQAHRYLSDARFVESRVNARSARYGNLRIRQELGQHGAVLDSDVAERLKDSELARARAVWPSGVSSEPAAVKATTTPEAPMAARRDAKVRRARHPMSLSGRTRQRRET
jgi:regulatory protein